MHFSATSDGQGHIGAQIRAILEKRNLTLSEVSEKTSALYGSASRFLLPHNLYYELKRGTFSPSLHQVFALSRISGYRLIDWLGVFGFDLHHVLRLQVLLPAKRTLLLDVSLEDPNALVPGFADRPGTLAVPAIAPLGQLLEFTAFERLAARASAHQADFLYAKIGREDALAFPRLVPGSIVRINRRRATELPRVGGPSSERLFLFEHGRGLCCSPVRRVGLELLLPVSDQLPYAQVELRLPEEVRVLGVVDLEIRPLANLPTPEVPDALARHWEPRALAPPAATLSQLLRHGRERTDLSLRDASAISRRIAHALGDDRYFVAPGSLSDYEAVDQPPRHLHKILTLCVLYGLKFSDFLRTAALNEEDAGQEAMADDLRQRRAPPAHPSRLARTQGGSAGFVDELHAQLDPVPFFLRSCLSELSGWAHPSLHDFFWIGGDAHPLHPYLVGGVLVLLNRRTKKPIHFRSKPLWQQPVYLIRRRDGTYLCAGCSLEEGKLIVHAYPQTICRPEQLRNQVEAEVVGQIMAVARSGWERRGRTRDSERKDERRLKSCMMTDCRTTRPLCSGSFEFRMCSPGAAVFRDAACLRTEVSLARFHSKSMRLSLHAAVAKQAPAHERSLSNLRNRTRDRR